jgi:precorrin-6B methylase 2
MQKSLVGQTKKGEKIMTKLYAIIDSEGELVANNLTWEDALEMVDFDKGEDIKEQK